MYLFALKLTFHYTKDESDWQNVEILELTFNQNEVMVHPCNLNINNV